MYYFGFNFYIENVNFHIKNIVYDLYLTSNSVHWIKISTMKAR